MTDGWMLDISGIPGSGSLDLSGSRSLSVGVVLVDSMGPLPYCFGRTERIVLSCCSTAYMDSRRSLDLVASCRVASFVLWIDGS